MHPIARSLAGVTALAFLAVQSSAAGAAERACRTSLDRGVLPAWARTGFSDPLPRMPHVVGRDGRIAAIVFGDPLTVPPRRDRDNKILWVPRSTPSGFSDLVIRAQRTRGTAALGRPVTRRVAGGPGPSIIDLPAPGCWRLSLRWSGRSDTLDLVYRR